MVNFHITFLRHIAANLIQINRKVNFHITFKKSVFENNTVGFQACIRSVRSVLAEMVITVFGNGTVGNFCDTLHS